MTEGLLLAACGACGALNRVPAARLQEKPICGQCRHPIFNGQPINLSAENFEKFVLRSDLPVVVDFWASWCGPCKTMAPMFASLAQQMEPWLRFAKLETDAVPQMATQFGIRSIPTLVVFKQGQEVARQSGVLPLPQLQQWLTQVTQ